MIPTLARLTGNSVSVHRGQKGCVRLKYLGEKTKFLLLFFLEIGSMLCCPGSDDWDLGLSFPNSWDFLKSNLEGLAHQREGSRALWMEQVENIGIG
jgi:hypothetical protein